MKHTLALLSAASVSVCSCAHKPVESKITVQEALRSVSEGLYMMKNETDKHRSSPNETMGLMPTEAEVTFNIVASKKDSGRVYVEVSPPPVTPINGKLGMEYGTEAMRQRGNQITVKFRSIFFNKITKANGDSVVTTDGPIIWAFWPDRDSSGNKVTQSGKKDNEPTGIGGIGTGPTPVYPTYILPGSLLKDPAKLEDELERAKKDKYLLGIDPNK